VSALSYVDGCCSSLCFVTHSRVIGLALSNFIFLSILSSVVKFNVITITIIIIVIIIEEAQVIVTLS